MESQLRWPDVKSWKSSFWGWYYRFGGWERKRWWLQSSKLYTYCSQKAGLILTNPRFCSHLTTKQIILSLRNQWIPGTHSNGPPEETSIQRPPLPGSLFFPPKVFFKGTKIMLCHLTRVYLSAWFQWVWQIPATSQSYVKLTHTYTHMYMCLISPCTFLKDDGKKDGKKDRKEYLISTYTMLDSFL